MERASVKPLIFKTKIVGILNITPDSFSDGGEAFAVRDALQRAQILLEAGADMLDVGAESTRPNAEAISPQAEIARLSPVFSEIMAMAEAHGVGVSLDTRHAKTAEFGLSHGVAWINDVSGATNADLLNVVAGDAHVKYVLMHSLGVPANPAITLPNDAELLPNLIAFFVRKIEHIGIVKERIIIDAGLGFGKCAHGSLNLMLASSQLQNDVGCSLLVGHSRKSMFKAVGAKDMAMREAATLLASAFLASQQIAYLRVHDVAAHVELLT